MTSNILELSLPLGLGFWIYFIIYKPKI